MPRPAKPWFRIYSDALDSRKLQRLKPQLKWTWFNLMCLSNITRPRGSLPSLTDIAYRLRTTEKQALADLKALKDATLLDESKGVYSMHNWDDWQYESDVRASSVPDSGPVAAPLRAGTGNVSATNRRGVGADGVPKSSDNERKTGGGAKKKASSDEKTASSKTIPGRNGEESGHSRIGSGPERSHSVPLDQSREEQNRNRSEQKRAREKQADPLDQLAVDFGAFGVVGPGTAQAMDWSVKEHGIERVQKAIRKASATGKGELPWSYIDEILDGGSLDEPRRTGRVSTPEPANSGLSAEHERLGLGKPVVLVPSPYRDLDTGGARNG